MKLRGMTGSLALAGMAFLIGGSWPPSAGAASITFVTPSGSSVGDGPVNAQATFTTSTDTLTIVLTDLLNDPKSVGQLLSDLSFNVVGGPSTGTLTSSSGVARTVNDDGSYSDGATIPTGWVLTNLGSQYTLDVLAAGGAGPAHLIIGGPNGSDVYGNAKGSIAGNKPHNPFLANSATFTLNLAGVTDATTIDNVVFSFGTTSGVNVPGVPGVVPEPASAILLGLGVGAVGLVGWRRRRASKSAA